MNETQNKITLWTGDYITGETDLHELLGQSFVANGCTLLLCTEGRAVVTANGRKLAFRKGSLALLFSDVLFTPLYLSPSFSTTYLCLSEKLMEDVYYKLTSAVFWESVYAVPINRLSDEQYSLVQGWFAQMQWIIRKGEASVRTALLCGSLLNLFLVIDSVWKQHALSLPEQFRKDRAWMLFGKFMSLLPKYCYERRDVKYYAARLCVTTDYLYKITVKVEQRTPKELINTFVVTEIKRYLNNTDLSIKDLTCKFHFEDPSYLCRFFRKQTGMSPQDYRNGQPPRI